jgi:exodeoxyribonuclease-3
MQVICASDYQIATAGIAATAIRSEVYKAERFSDHAPLITDYNFK